MNIVALGHCACKIADKFSQYPQYTIYKLDVGLIEKTKHDKTIRQQSTPEEFEAKSPPLKAFFKNIKEEDVLFICAGGSAISGMILRTLEHLKNSKITILYIRPDLNLLDKKMILQERMTHGILQEYARSGVFDRIYLVDNVSLEQIIGDIPIIQYYDKLNELIATTVHMINVYKHIDPIIENKIDVPIITRIATFGIFDFNTNINKLFYPLEYATNHTFYYAFNKKELENDGKLLQTIKKQIKEKGEESKVSFGVYSTDYKENFIYCESATHFVQGLKFEQSAS